MIFNIYQDISIKMQNNQDLAKTALPNGGFYYINSNFHNRVTAAPVTSAQQNNEKQRTQITKIVGSQVNLLENPHPLLVLQKAQIERLTEQLNQYKSKFRHLDKEELDKFSYQVQIKQLFDSNNKNKKEIQRLSQSLRSLVKSNEGYRKQLTNSNQKINQYQQAHRNFKGNFDQLLSQYNVVVENFQKYRIKSQQSAANYQKQIALGRAYLQNLRTNNEELAWKVGSIPNLQQIIQKLSMEVEHFKTQTQKLYEEKIFAQQKISNLTDENNRCNERLFGVMQSRQHEINQMKQERRQFRRQMKQIQQAQNQKNQSYSAYEKSLVEKQLLEVRSRFQELQKEKKKADQKLKQNAQIIDKLYSKKQAKHREQNFQGKRISQLQDMLQQELFEKQKLKLLNKCTIKQNQDEIKKLELEVKQLKLNLQNSQPKQNQGSIKIRLLTLQSNKVKSQANSQQKQNRNDADLQKKNKDLIKEREQLSKMLNNKVIQNEQLKKKLINHEIELKDEFHSNLFNQTRMYQTKLSAIESDSQKATKSYEQAKVKLLNQIDSYKNEIVSLKQERAQIAHLYDNKTSQNQKLKLKILSIQEEMKQHSQKKLTNIQNEAKIAKQNLDKMTNSFEQLKISSKQHQNELLKMNQVLNQRINMYQQSQNIRLNEIQFLTYQKELLNSQTKEYNLKISEILNENKQLQELLLYTQQRSQFQLKNINANKKTLQQELTKANQILKARDSINQANYNSYNQLNKKIITYQECLSKLQTELISIQLLTHELKQERQLILKKNAILIKEIHTANQQMKRLNQDSEKVSLFFKKESTVAQDLDKHFEMVQNIFQDIQKQGAFSQKDLKVQTPTKK